MEEKKFDINSFIGMILIGGILFWWMSSNQPEIDQNVKTTSEQVTKLQKTMLTHQQMLFLLLKVIL